MTYKMYTSLHMKIHTYVHNIVWLASAGRWHLKPSLL